MISKYLIFSHNTYGGKQYSSAPLSTGDTHQDLREMLETKDSTEPIIYTHTYTFRLLFGIYALPASAFLLFGALRK